MLEVDCTLLSKHFLVQQKMFSVMKHCHSFELSGVVKVWSMRTETTEDGGQEPESEPPRCVTMKTCWIVNSSLIQNDMGR